MVKSVMSLAGVNVAVNTLGSAVAIRFERVPFSAVRSAKTKPMGISLKVIVTVVGPSSKRVLLANVIVALGRSVSMS